MYSDVKELYEIAKF